MNLNYQTISALVATFTVWGLVMALLGRASTKRQLTDTEEYLEDRETLLVRKNAEIRDLEYAIREQDQQKHNLENRLKELEKTTRDRGTLYDVWHWVDNFTLEVYKQRAYHPDCCLVAEIVLFDPVDKTTEWKVGKPVTVPRGPAGAKVMNVANGEASPEDVMRFLVKQEREAMS